MGFWEADFNNHVFDNGAHTFTANVTGESTPSEPFTVEVLTHAPVAVDTTFDVIEDDANGTVVGTVEVSDEDASDEASFEIVSGNADRAFFSESRDWHLACQR